MRDESWGPRLANPFAEARRQGCATDGYPRVPARCARQWTRRAGRGRVWGRQDLGCPRTCDSHTLNAQPTLQGPSPGQRRRGCAFTPPHAPPLAPPIIEGSTPVGWPLRGLQPLVRVPTRLTLGPIQPTQQGEGGEGGGCSVGQGGYAWQVSSVPYICLSVWVRMGLISVPSGFSLSACVLVSACLSPSLHFSPPLCQPAPPPLQLSDNPWARVLSNPLLAASGLHPLPFFLLTAACLPWQPSACLGSHEAPMVSPAYSLPTVPTSPPPPPLPPGRRGRG